MSGKECRDNVNHWRSTYRQYLAAIVVNISTFCIGNVIGWTSPMQPLLSSAKPPIGTEEISTEDISWLGSVNYIGAIVGCFFWGIITDRLGRKTTAILVAIPLTLCWTLKLFAQNIWWILFARVIAGIAHGGVILNVPIYVAEIADDKIKGSLGSFLILSMNVGLVFSNVIGSLTSYHTLSSICLCIPIIYLACVSLLPETPYFLWNEGKKDRAKISLMWLRGGNNTQITKEIDVLKKGKNNSSNSPSLSSLFKLNGVRKAMVISLIISFGQQCSGIMAVMTYTYVIIQQSGSSLSSQHAMIVIGAFQICSSVMSTAVIDRVGRRVLLLFSFTTMAVSLSVLGGYLHFQNENQDIHPVLKSLPIICISIIVFSYSIGAGPVPAVVISEIFPPNIRGYAISKVLLLYYISTFCAVKTFPFFTGSLGKDGCFLMYGIFCVITSTFIYFLVPETKNKSLESILKILNGEEETILDTSESSELVTPYINKIVKSNVP